MMCADFLDLKRLLDTFQEEGVDYLHIDIMDGHYVPNFTLGFDFCRTLRDFSTIPLDIHFMVDNPSAHIDRFSTLAGSIYCFHPEICADPLQVLRRVRAAGLRPGIALRPEVSLQSVKSLLPHADLVTIMTVHPGYAGQPLVTGTIEKIAETAAWAKAEKQSLEIEVDGNVSWENIPKMREAGATVFVAGTSSIFSKGGDLRDRVRRFRGMIAG
jgi:ribulose-phosphate 3-epimerase